MIADVQSYMASKPETTSKGLATLEDWYADDSLTCAPSALLVLQISLMPPTLPQLTVSEEDFYRRAVRNFRSSMVYYRRLSLLGGYYFKPDQQNAQLLEAEFVRLKRLLLAITSAFRKESVRCHVLHYTVILGFNFEVFLLSSPLVMQENFGRCATFNEIKERQFNVKFLLNGVDCTLTGIIKPDLHLCSQPFGRHAISVS
ncbi:hypothetical protein M3Y96_00016900 [Aphelenchoides besseyi]|nr:hypothetical protein M3Y96_00016900 [Aphelenchoides besseyi]